jgi:hypothetical protein
MNHMEKCLVCAFVGAVLFFVLSPGVLLTLPPKCNNKVFLALKDDKQGCSTSYMAAFVHSLVFGVVMFLLCLMTKSN